MQPSAPKCWICQVVFRAQSAIKTGEMKHQPERTPLFRAQKKSYDLWSVAMSTQVSSDAHAAQVTGLWLATILHV